MTVFYTLLTAYGEAAFAEALISGEPVSIAEMAVGDGGGSLPVPDRDSPGLVNEVYRATINRVVIADRAANVIRVEMIMQPQVGGFWLREAALYSAGGECLAIANLPASYKPQLEEGAGRTQSLNILIAVSSTAAVALSADPAVIVASVAEIERVRSDVKDYTDDEITSLQGGLKEEMKEAIAAAIETARRDFWEEENPVGTVRFYAKKVDPNTLYPWSTWTYTGENKSLRIGKADGSDVGQGGGNDTLTIARANLPAVKVKISGKAASVDLGEKTTGEAGAAEFRVYRFGQDGRENTVAPFSLDDVQMGDIPQTVSIESHKHTLDLGSHDHDVNGETEALGEGKSLSIVEAHTLLMCWARTA